MIKRNPLKLIFWDTGLKSIPALSSMPAIPPAEAAVHPAAVTIKKAN